MEQHLRLIAPFLISILSLAGCATERHIAPSVSGAPRTGLELKPPILGAVFDGRTTQEPKDAGEKLQTDLRQLYGQAIQWGGYFTKIPHGRVAVRVRVVTLGASFGSRLVSSTAFASAVGLAQVNAIGPWSSVAGSVSSEQSVYAGSFSGEGWWNGAAWIDLEIQDFRGEKPISFTLPIIVAEHRESNLWGYASGDKAAQVAWNSVASQLTRALGILE